MSLGKKRLTMKHGIFTNILTIDDLYQNKLVYKLSPITVVIWAFPEMGVPLNHPCLDSYFHEINHPAIGVPLCQETPIYPLITPFDMELHFQVENAHGEVVCF